MFQANDRVTLKNGGSEMTVIGCGDVAGAPHVWCRWLDVNKQKQKAAFAEAALVLKSETIPSAEIVTNVCDRAVQSPTPRPKSLTLKRV
jgi:uncharacterized protein YodC (DUF2158 family)